MVSYLQDQHFFLSKVFGMAWFILDLDIPVLEKRLQSDSLRQIPYLRCLEEGAPYPLVEEAVRLIPTHVE